MAGLCKALTYCIALSLPVPCEKREGISALSSCLVSGLIMDRLLQVLLYSKSVGGAYSERWGFAGWGVRGNGAPQPRCLVQWLGARWPAFPHFPGPEKSNLSRWRGGGAGRAGSRRGVGSCLRMSWAGFDDSWLPAPLGGSASVCGPAPPLLTCRRLAQ